MWSALSAGLCGGSPYGTEGDVDAVGFPTVGAVKPPTIAGTSGYVGVNNKVIRPGYPESNSCCLYTTGYTNEKHAYHMGRCMEQ